MRSSGLRLPSAVARARASCEGSKLHFINVSEIRMEGGCKETYEESSRKRLTLCMVMRAVGEDEMMMIGWLWPAMELEFGQNPLSGMR